MEELLLPGSNKRDLLDIQGMGSMSVNAGRTSVVDLDFDALVLCAAKLQLPDLANMAGVCRQFRQAAYADSIWETHCRRQWPAQTASWGGMFQFCGGRDAFVGRYYASQQFRYHDPVGWTCHLPPTPISHIVLDKDSIAVSQGSNISIMSVGGPYIKQMLRDHNGKITCMKLYPRESVPSLFSKSCVLGRTNNLLVTSSTDQTVRIWGNDRPRTFKHRVAVTTLGDRLLGRNNGAAVVATGGGDGRIRLWSLHSAGGNRGISPLATTFHAHEQAVKELIVAGHNDSLLVSASKSWNSKVRVWDANASSTTAGCVGTIHAPVGAVLKLFCDGATCFVSGSCRVIAIDLRTMSRVATVAVDEEIGISSVARCLGDSNFGSGGNDGTIKLWDMRKCTDDQPEPWAILGEHAGAVQCLHLDRYKVVSGSHTDRLVRIWDAKTGKVISTLDTTEELDSNLFSYGVSSLVVQGSRLLTGTCGDVSGVLRYRDFSNCTSPLEDGESMSDSRISKFWDSDFS